jgi:hypothetical protein
MACLSHYLPADLPLTNLYNNEGALEPTPSCLLAEIRASSMSDPLEIALDAQREVRQTHTSRQATPAPERCGTERTYVRYRSVYMLLTPYVQANGAKSALRT